MQDEHLPVPVLGRSVTLSVAVVSNPDLPPISEVRVEKILEEAAREASATFGTRVMFKSPSRLDIGQFFRRFDTQFADSASKDWIYDFKRGKGDIQRLATALEATFRKSGSKLEDLQRFAEPYLLVSGKSRDFHELAEAVATTHITRLERLRAYRTASGQSLVTEDPYNEYVYWDAAGHGALGYDVVITNQLLASAEYKFPDLHSSLRGGITNGLTSECADCSYGLYSLLSTFAMWSDDPVTHRLRGGRALTEQDAVRAAALVLVHELGHLLFHYGHPFAQTRCVMSPTPSLRFQERLREIDPKGCTFGAHPTLKPGFYKFRDLRNQVGPSTD